MTDKSKVDKARLYVNNIHDYDVKQYCMLNSD